MHTNLNLIYNEFTYNLCKETSESKILLIFGCGLVEGYKITHHRYSCHLLDYIIYVISIGGEYGGYGGYKNKYRIIFWKKNKKNIK